MHTSAAICMNENTDPDVLHDLAGMLDRIVPESRDYRHSDEGPDDMPAHGKSAVVGVSVTLPVARGRLVTGTWQGVYLVEARNRGGSRRITATVQGVVAA